MRCFVVAGFLLTSASRGPSAIAEPLVELCEQTDILVTVLRIPPEVGEGKKGRGRGRNNSMTYGVLARFDRNEVAPAAVAVPRHDDRKTRRRTSDGHRQQRLIADAGVPHRHHQTVLSHTDDGVAAVKAAFHGTDTDILADILATRECRRVGRLPRSACHGNNFRKSRVRRKDTCRRVG